MRKKFTRLCSWLQRGYIKQARGKKTLQNNGLCVAFSKVEVYYLGVIEKYMTSMGVFRDQFKEMGHPDLKK